MVLVVVSFLFFFLFSSPQRRRERQRVSVALLWATHKNRFEFENSRRKASNELSAFHIIFDSLCECCTFKVVQSSTSTLQHSARLTHSHVRWFTQTHSHIATARMWLSNIQRDKLKWLCYEATLRSVLYIHTAHSQLYHTVARFSALFLSLRSHTRSPRICVYMWECVLHARSLQPPYTCTVDRSLVVYLEQFESFRKRKRLNNQTNKKNTRERRN